MGNNLTPYSFATGKENYYLFASNFSFIEKDKIDYDTILYYLGRIICSRF